MGRRLDFHGGVRADPYRYSAFISYNHQDARHAGWLHRALEGYRVPKRLWGQDATFGVISGKLLPVFRDREELASSADLASSVKAALATAANLVVLCSPRSAKSKWVNREVETFIEAGHQDRILCIIVDGEPHASDPEIECLPPALLDPAVTEPLAADARKTGDGKRVAVLKLLAAILDVPFDDLRQREAQRRQRRLALLASASFSGLVLTTGLAAFAWLSRNEAVAQRDIARQRTLTAERTLAFVKSMFKLADPSEAKGENITAREVVDRGARQITSDLETEPTVRVELAVTLAEVYGSLGLFKRSDELLFGSLVIKQDAPLTAARQLTAIGESKFRLGEYKSALRAFRKAKALAGSGNFPELDSRILVGMGQSFSALGDERAADNALGEALRVDRSRPQSALPDVARDLEAIGINKFYASELDRAQPFIEQALRIRTNVEGRASPSVTDNRNMLANIAHQRGQLPRAEAYYRLNLEDDEKVLGPDHPDLAVTLNNLARVLLEQRRFAEAKLLLGRALEVSVAQRGETHDVMAFMFSNLALAQRYSGNLTEADALFARASAAARLHDHPFLGPILVDWSELDCTRNRVGRGLSRLGEAELLVRQAFPKDPWRMAWLESVRGRCLLAGGKREGIQLIKLSAPVILERWPASTLFGHEAMRPAHLAT